MQASIKKQLMHVQFLKREETTVHRKYEDELGFHATVRSGDIQGLQKHLAAPWPDGSMGKLSENPVRSAQYLFVCNITIIARIAVEEGIELETAYSISDLYIQTVDKCASVNEVDALRREMLEYFTKLMADLKKRNVFSRPIVQSLDYIYDNLHQRVKVDEISGAVGLSPSYFSTLFKKEMGVSVSEYIRRKRVEAAENMLRYSDFTLTQISQYLSFSSYSHFADIFRDYAGVTPKEYRKRYFRKRSVE